MDVTDLLDRIGWSVPHLARRFGVSPRLAYGWVRGTNTRGNLSAAPLHVVAYLEAVALAVEAVPLPEPLEARTAA